MGMGLTELPTAFFRMRTLEHLYIGENNLCSLPSEIAHLIMLDTLYVRVSKRVDRDLMHKITLFQVWNNQLTSLPPELGLLSKLRVLKVRQQTR